MYTQFVSTSHNKQCPIIVAPLSVEPSLVTQKMPAKHSINSFTSRSYWFQITRTNKLNTEICFQWKLHQNDILSSMALPPFVGSWPRLQFRNLIYTGGRTPCTSDQPVSRPLLTHRTTKTDHNEIRKDISEYCITFLAYYLIFYRNVYCISRAVRVYLRISWRMFVIVYWHVVELKTISTTVQFNFATITLP